MPKLRSTLPAVRAAVEEVLQRGDDPNKIIPGAGVSPMHLACYYALGRQLTGRLLAAGGDPHLAVGRIRSPAVMAAEQGNWEELDEVLKAGGGPGSRAGGPTAYSSAAAVPLCEWLTCVALSSAVVECVAGEQQCQRCLSDAAGVPHAPGADFFKVLDVLFSTPGWTPTPALRCFLETNADGALGTRSGVKLAMRDRVLELAELRCGGSGSGSGSGRGRGSGSGSGSGTRAAVPAAVIAEPPVATPTPTAPAPAAPAGPAAEDFTFSVGVGAAGAAPLPTFSPGPLFAVHLAAAEAAIGHRLAGMTVGGAATRR